jgi:hypothetical protein
MCSRFRIACVALALAATPVLDAVAQGFAAAPAPPPCVAAKTGPPDARLADKIVAAQRSIEAKKPGAWSALIDLAGYACAVTGDRVPVDTEFQRCIRECADQRDVYFAHVFYAQALDRFGDLAGAENQYLQALQSREDVQGAVTAYMGYASMLERHGRTRDALDVLNRFAGDWSYVTPTMMFKLSLMRALGIDTQAEEDAAKQRSPAADFARMRADAPALSAIPVERNPLAQMPFGRTIEVVGEAWIEPARGAGAPQPGHLDFHSMSMPGPSMPDASTLPRSVALKPGQRFLVVADLGDRGCRVAVADARYDLEECPWRTGRSDASLFRVVEERTPVPSPLVVRPIRPPIPIGDTPESVPAPLADVWQDMYRMFTELERRGQPIYAVSVLEEKAGLTKAEAAQVRAAGEEYLRQLERIEADLRRQISERFGPSDQARLAGLPVAAADPQPPLAIDGGKLPEGKTLQEVLTEEGVIARVDAQKDALLRAHLEQIARAIGPEKAAALERVVREQIAPNVQRVIRAGPPVPVPFPGAPLPRPGAPPPQPGAPPPESDSPSTPR